MRPRITGLTVDQIRKSAEWIAQPKAGNARRRTMFAYEKGLIWGNDNYRTNGALVNVALATGNIGRPGGGCVRMGGHQEGYSRPSDAHVGRPAAYVDKLLIEGKGGVHHIWACDHYKTTLNAFKFKQAYKKRTDMVKEAMMTVPYGDRAAMVNAIVGAIKKGGLFAVDVDIVPTKIGEACHVWLPAATSGEANLTSMNGERRMRLTEKYMDPPGQAMPDSLIAARIANNMERVLREQGKGQYADQFKGFDWKTEEDAFMDGYHNHEKGGEFVTYERLRAMGTNGFQEPATAFTDGKIIGTKRLFADGKFDTKDGKAKFMETQWRGLQAPGKEDERKKWPFLVNNGRANIVWQNAYLDQDNEFVMDRMPYPYIQMNPDDMDGAEAEAGRSRRGLQRQRLDPGDGLSDADCEAEADLHAVRLSDRRAGQRGVAGRERVHHPELQADLGRYPQDRGCAGGREASQLQVDRIHGLRPKGGFFRNSCPGCWPPGQFHEARQRRPSAPDLARLPPGHALLGGFDDLAVFLDEAADMRIGKNIEHGFRRPAQSYALRRHDDRPVDQDRMSQHEIEQLVVAPFGIGKPELRIGRALFAQQPATGIPIACDQFDQPCAARRVLQIFDDHRLLAALPDHGQRVARGAAGRIVIDRHAHVRAYLVDRRFALPASYQPRDSFTRWTTESITGTSTSTPTTVASAAPELRPNRLMAAATASSKKLLAPISAAGAATHQATPKRRLSQ